MDLPFQGMSMNSPVASPPNSSPLRARAGLGLHPLEANPAPFPEPSDHLCNRAEPDIKRPQHLKQPYEKVAPKPLWNMASARHRSVSTPPNLPALSITA